MHPLNRRIGQPSAAPGLVGLQCGREVCIGSSRIPFLARPAPEFIPAGGSTGCAQTHQVDGRPFHILAFAPGGDAARLAARQRVGGTSACGLCQLSSRFAPAKVPVPERLGSRVWHHKNGNHVFPGPASPQAPQASDVQPVQTGPRLCRSGKPAPGLLQALRRTGCGGAQLVQRKILHFDGAGGGEPADAPQRQSLLALPTPTVGDAQLIGNDLEHRRAGRAAGDHGSWAVHCGGCTVALTRCAVAMNPAISLSATESCNQGA